MNSELQAIKDVWDGMPRDAELARTMSDAYVASHPDEFVEFENMSTIELADKIDRFRIIGQSEEVQRVEVWLLHRFNPQNIGGIYQPQIRIAGEVSE